MKTFKDLREATMSTWTVTVQKPVNKLKKGDKQVVKARSGFEAINKAMKLWKDPALKAASADSFKITKESIDEGKMKRNPAIDNNPDVKAARKAHADGTWDGNVDKEGEAIVHIKGKPYTVTNNNESVKEDIDEGVDKSSPVYKEYLSLKKMSIGDLRKMVGQQHRGPVDLKSYDKQGAISDLLRNKFGGKKVDAAMGLSEAYKKGDKVTIKNAKKYDAFSKPEVTGVVMGISKDGVQVKVGTGSMTVDPKDIKESLDEAFYKAGSEKSKLDSGYRSHLKDDEGKTAYIGNVSYKKADTAKGEAEVYGDAYYKTAGKSGNERAADKAIVKYRQAHKKDIVESLDEAVSPIVKSTAVGRKNLLKVNAEVVKLMALSDDKTMKKYYADILKQLNWADGRLKQLGKPE